MSHPLITSKFSSGKSAGDGAVHKAGHRHGHGQESTSTLKQHQRGVEDKQQHGGKSRAAAAAAAGSNSTIKDTPLSTSEATKLNLFLRSARSVVPLQIADILGAIDDKTGERSIPVVRKGKIRTSSNHDNDSGNAGILCCIIDAQPFDKCEIVATVVKKNAIYRQATTLRRSITESSISYTGKGKERAIDDPTDVKEEAQLIFYELDDDSGASITCCVNPSKVYAREISASRRQEREILQRQASTSQSDTTQEEASEDGQDDYDEDMSTTPRASGSTRSSHNNLQTPQPKKTKSDPRLWIYRYKSPPRPVVRKASPVAPSFEVPVYNEGTVIRIVGKIFVNPARGNERQMEASSVECLYEPECRIGRRKIPAKGNKYAEWHHTVRCKKARKDFQDRQKVRALIGLDPSSTSSAEMSQVVDETMQEDSLPAFDESANTTTSSSMISSTSLLDASRLPDRSLTTDTSKRGKKGKLPSCSTLYKQKIPITKEIFSLYAHQYFRDLEKKTRFNTQQDEESVVVKVTLDQLKEDKNMKWLAEIYARTEGKKRLAAAQASSVQDHQNDNTPRAKTRHTHTSAAESSVIIPSSSPSQSRSSASRSFAISESTSNASFTSTNGKVKLSPAAVEKIRNDLFRSTIHILVKDGVIVVFPAEFTSSQVSVKDKKTTCTCAEKARREVEKVPPLMTMDGRSLRDISLAVIERQGCTCPVLPPPAPPQESYALLSARLLLPVVQGVVAAMNVQDPLETDELCKVIKRQDDKWRYINKDLVEEYLRAL